MGITTHSTASTHAELRESVVSLACPTSIVLNVVIFPQAVTLATSEAHCIIERVFHVPPFFSSNTLDVSLQFNNSIHTSFPHV